ncbi:hypothetical protein GQ44DRAFT_724696 [Phaeosphaeriaceae sp. PMI808]|nr:hypothetical protein GQ44DRAFT_724696 [Phaeosphaeriaceae sp. PMI808]
MPPVEPDASARNNLFAYAPFGGQIALVVGLTTHPLRRTYATIFSILAALSLASVTTFAVLWRIISYAQWMELGAHTSPNGLWTGWYGTGEDGRWYLGDWIRDIDLSKESDRITILMPEGFLYTSQHYVGLLASAIFFGVEGHRRKLPATTIASFVILSSTGSLGYALSLFFVTILYTPLTVHNEDFPLRDALFTPSPVIYYVPIILSLLFLNSLPEILLLKMDVRTLNLLRSGKTAIPLLLAFAPQIVPVSLGRQHSSRAAAYRSYARVFHFLSIASFLLYWRLFLANISENIPNERHHIWDLFENSVESSKSSRVLSGLSTTARKLKCISKDPVISITSLDVLFATISLLAWTFTRNLDVDAILDNSMLAFLVPKHEKHVAFEDDETRLSDINTESETALETTPPKMRGRPAKNKAVVNGTSISAAEPTKRSGGRVAHIAKHQPEADSPYRPTSATLQEVSETEADGASAITDLAHGGESTALALFLMFVGGLGQLAAGALGAEVTGPQE